MAYFECLVDGSGDGSTLTVTCYSGFAGLTISITNGVDTFSDVCPSTSPYEVVFEGLANGTWTLSTVYNGVTYTDTVEVNLTTQFYPIPNGATATPTDDIQTWLHCADIWDKNYTTISQVLSDTSTLLALISSNNAADYMARSTNWASSVCVNQTAMGYIGNNDYCADKLLSNSTWRAEICSSTYFESVLNVKVPTMTSNTSPSGIVSGTNISGGSNNAYKFFTSSEVGISSNGIITYDFGSNITIYVADINNKSGSDDITFKIQNSDDNVTRRDCTSVKSLSHGVSTKLTLEQNIAACRYITFYMLTTTGDIAWLTGQFYGRAAI